MSADERKKAWLKERDQIVQRRVDKWNTDISILVTGHADQRVFTQACLKSLQGLGWILLTYDNPLRYATHMPKPEVFRMVDQFFMKHITKEIPGPTYPQFWNFKHGCEILNSSKGKFVFVIGADSVLERPEGLPEIVDMLGSGDIIACSTRNPKRHGGLYCNTKSFLIRKEAFKTLMEYIESTFIPFDSQYGNMECRFGSGIKEVGLKEIAVPVLPGEDQFAYYYDDDGNSINRGTWGELLGYRHLGGEHKKRRLDKLIPIEEKYFDKSYLRPKETQTLGQYWKTGDSKFLEAWWRT